MSAEISAIREFISQLPEEMIELALEAVHLKDQIEVATDLQTQTDLQNELDLVNRKIILSVCPGRSMWK